nr:hypothetical protein GCM10025730_01040 [Promicromonospora thailandica]
MSDHRPRPTSETPPHHAGPGSLRAAWVALSGLSAVFLFEMLDSSVLNVALPTIGRELGASTTGLQWVTSSYSVVFGGLMIALSAVADRFGRRTVMLAGLVLLALAGLATAFVSTTGQLVAVRVATGVAAAMTTPGSMALAYRLFADEHLRVRAMTLVSTVGLVGLAVGPTAGGLVLSFAPWQTLLLVNVPVAAIALVCVRLGVPADQPHELHGRPIDVVGALLGTAPVVLGLLAPTVFVDDGAGSWQPWVAAGERPAREPCSSCDSGPPCTPCSIWDCSGARWWPAGWRSRRRPPWPWRGSATWSPCSSSSTGGGRRRRPPSACCRRWSSWSPAAP